MHRHATAWWPRTASSCSTRSRSPRRLDGRTHVRDDDRLRRRRHVGAVGRTVGEPVRAHPRRTGRVAGRRRGRAPAPGSIRAKVVDLELCPTSGVKLVPRRRAAGHRHRRGCCSRRLDQTLVLDELERFSGARLVVRQRHQRLRAAHPRRPRRPVDRSARRWMTRSTTGPMDGEPASPLHRRRPARHRPIPARRCRLIPSARGQRDADRLRLRLARGPSSKKSLPLSSTTMNAGKS